MKISIRLIIISLLLIATNILFLNNGCFSVNAKDLSSSKSKILWINDLKSLLGDNNASIMAVIIRTLNAKDLNGNDVIEPEKGEQTGSFLNATERLDSLKELGINTLHILPFFPTGKKYALGTAGSLYSPADLLAIDPMLDDTSNETEVNQEAKQFINECHKRNIRVMLDIPCCGSYDLFEKSPELFMTDENGQAVIPHDWTDIRLFKVYEDAKGKKLNKPLLDLHKNFIDFCIDLEIDGIRVDVARTKPPKFWAEVIKHARKKDPEFGFLAESFEYEEKSGIKNIPPDRPTELLESGFDSYYGIYNSLPKLESADDFHKIIKKYIDRSNRFKGRKTVIGGFTSHDEISPMILGGVEYYYLITALQSFLPLTNPYFVSGFESGDSYDYKFKDTLPENSYTDYEGFFLHPGRIDIFNLSRKPEGNNPRISRIIKKILTARKKFLPIVTNGDYIPLKVSGNSKKILAFARNLKNETIVIIANIDIKNSVTGNINLHEDKKKKPYQVIYPHHFKDMIFAVTKEGISFKLPPSGVMVLKNDDLKLKKVAQGKYRIK